MKIHKNSKAILGVLLILAISIIADLTFHSMRVHAGEEFDISSQVSLYQMRPIVLVVFYIVLLTLGYLLIYRGYSDRFSSYLLILIGSTILLGMSDPLINIFPSFLGLDVFLEKLNISQLGLTLHTGAIMTALGVFWIFLHFFQKRRV